MKKIYLAFLSFLMMMGSMAQKADQAIALDLITKHSAAVGLEKMKQTDYFVSSSYESDGIRLVYVQQSLYGLPIFNQIKTLSFKNDQVASAAGAFIIDAEKIASQKSATPALKPLDAIGFAFTDQKLAVPTLVPQMVTATSFNYGKPLSVTENVIGDLKWFPVEKMGKIVSLNLVWDVFVAPKGTDNEWHILVDAANGKILYKYNQVVSEGWDLKHAKNPLAKQNLRNTASSKYSFAPGSPSVVFGANYLVIPYPAESPIHPGGTAAVRSNPWTNAPGNASTLGWHSDGTNDYTITRGNNAWATEDQANSNQNTGLTASSSTINDPLNFNFPPNYTQDPRTPAFQQFAITNLFYWNNIVHDISYQYGFTEPAGNFQRNNLSRGGAGNDDVIALAQSGAGGPIGNNANFSTPADGSRPRMRMYLFDAVPTTLVTVNAPSSIAGNYQAVEGNFSTTNQLAVTGPKTGQVIWFDDDGGFNHEACGGSLTPLAGKIALINRGNCNFTVKVAAAQAAGAIAVIMVNNVATAPIIMGGGPDNTITIPAVMISQANGAILAAQIANNLNVTINGNPGVVLDGDLDNGVIAHEYTHGISNRLTGGPTNISCLNNAEQGGEGWSDYFGLMVTTDWATTPLTDGPRARPIGNYVTGQSASTGVGIRLYPYSTNLTTNPLTYANMGTGTVGTEVHNIGEILCVTLWEMTWAIIAQENSINPNLYNYTATGNGGNSIALKLVLEGMKLQPCSPGYVDVRNAILAADRNLYCGKHACAIWTAFAKRGLGFGASQGSANSATDQTASTTLPPAPTVATQPIDVTVAAGANATFTANAGADVNLIYQWQVSTNGGTTWTNIDCSIASTLTLNAVTGSMNGYKYRAIVSIGCATTTTSVATLTVTGGATAPTFSTQPSNVTACAGTTATFTAAATGTGVTYAWEVSTNGGTTWAPVTPAATTTTLTLTNVTVGMNNNRYRLVATNTVGSTTSNAGILTVNAVPNAPTVSTPITYCQGATAVALTATGNSLLWYTTATGGTGSTTAPIPSTSTAGSTTFYVSQTVNGCESPRASIVVTVNAAPAAPTVTTPVAYCQNATATPLTATGTSLLWYTTATGGTGSATAPTPSTATVGSTTFYVSQTVAGCESPRASIVVNVTATTPAPTVTSPVTYCQNATATPLTATGTGLLWYTAATGGTGSTTAPTPSTTTVGSTTFYVSQTTSCGEGPRASIVVNVTAPPAAPTVSLPLTYCQGATAPSLTATGSNLLWYTTATGGTGSATAPVPSTATIGSITYYVSQTVGCESPRASITVNTVAVPAAPTASSPVTYCQGATATALTATGSNLLWYTTATGGTGSATAPTPSTTTVGSTTFYVSQTTTCESPRTAIVVNVTAATSITSQPAAVVTCSGANATFTVAATGTNVTYQWQSATSCAGTFTNIAGANAATYTVNNVTTAMSGTAYRVIVSGTCAPTSVTSTCVTLTVNAATTITTQPTDITRCTGTAATFTAAAVGGTISYQWQVSTDGGTTWTNIAGETNATYTIASVTAAMANNRYRALISSSCAANTPTNAAILTVQSAPSITTQPADITSCTTTATFNVVATGTGIVYQWQLSTDGGTTYTNISGANSATLVIPNLTAAMANYKYRVVVSTTSCGTVTSNSVTARVGLPPVIVLTASPTTAFNPSIQGGLYTTVSPVGNYTYQWTLNGQVLTGITATSITKANGLLNDFGTYQVRVTDAVSGCFGLSNSVTITDIANQRDQLFISPNPTQGLVRISYYSSVTTPQQRIITVYDAKGARVMSKNFTVAGRYGTMELDLSRMNQGTYTIMLSDASGKKIVSDKVIKY
ncbi:M36 family metallopeptidase [Ferruginibacter yonginensis]|uniref:M36 family metallopeptidase n=1 Tax=Ferruginibacter yonginensis TaxID=1310416 RepID=A0ABV8QWD5_9BACT